MLPVYTFVARQYCRWPIANECHLIQHRRVARKNGDDFYRFVYRTRYLRFAEKSAAIDSCRLSDRRALDRRKIFGSEDQAKSAKGKAIRKSIVPFSMKKGRLFVESSTYQTALFNG